MLCSHELAWSASLGWYGRVCKTLFEHSRFLQKFSKEGELVCISAWRIDEARVSMWSLQVLPSFTEAETCEIPLHRYTLPCTLFLHQSRQFSTPKLGVEVFHWVWVLYQQGVCHTVAFCHLHLKVFLRQKRRRIMETQIFHHAKM
jgi:hypothetical protein